LIHLKGCQYSVQAILPAREKDAQNHSGELIADVCFQATCSMAAPGRHQPDNMMPESGHTAENGMAAEYR
jgi:hypothetical protein